MRSAWCPLKRRRKKASSHHFGERKQMVRLAPQKSSQFKCVHRNPRTYTYSCFIYRYIQDICTVEILATIFKCRRQKQPPSTRTTGKARLRIPPSIVRLNRTGLGQAGMSLCKRRSQSPVLQISYMPFKNRIDKQVFRSFLRKQGIGCLISPIQRQSCCVWDEEVVEVNARIYLHQFISHAWPRQIVYPSRVRTKKLRRPRGDPFGQPVVVFLRG